MFEGKNTKRIEYLEEERKKQWDRITAIERKIEFRPTDFEKEAKQASKKAAEFKNKTEERLTQAQVLLNEIKNISLEVSNQKNEIESLKIELDKLLSEANNASDDINNRSENLLSHVDKIQAIFAAHPNLKAEVEELNDLIDAIEEDASKSNSTFKGIVSKKSEIDELHREIIGYEEEDEEGVIVEIGGLKTELEKSYANLAAKSNELKNQITVLEKEGKDSIDSFIKENQTTVNDSVTNFKTEYEEITKKIATLLPDAMTAGLSSAFIAKKKEEETTYGEYKKKFNIGIGLLIVVSFLPILVSLYFLYSGVLLTEVIDRSPKVIFAFLPLYIPIIWTTFSANKKINLSKRLIEEYSHKQVLSMTVEGLSNQIDSLEDNSISRDLRNQLLYNFLAATSENPGKLISNYQNSDHPIMEIFNRKKKDNNSGENSKTISETIEDNTKSIVEKTADEIKNKISKTITNGAIAEE